MGIEINVKEHKEIAPGVLLVDILTSIISLPERL